MLWLRVSHKTPGLCQGRGPHRPASSLPQVAVARPLYTCFAHGPLHWPASQRDLASPGQEVQERTASTQHRSHKSFHNLISEMAPHHFHRVPFNRHESVSPAHTQGEGIPFGKKYWETRRWAHGDHLSVLPVQLSTKRAVLLDGLISTATKAPGP